jgi:hypothetical protein
MPSPRREQLEIDLPSKFLKLAPNSELLLKFVLDSEYFHLRCIDFVASVPKIDI